VSFGGSRCFVDTPPEQIGPNSKTHGKHSQTLVLVLILSEVLCQRGFYWLGDHVLHLFASESAGA
jgi:hypothetical protein